MDERASGERIICAAYFSMEFMLSEALPIYSGDLGNVAGDGAPGGYADGAAVSAARPPADYTARVIPDCDGVAVPLEAARILWER